MTDTRKSKPQSKKQIADDLQSKAQAAGQQFKDKGSEQLKQYESQAAGSMDSVAEAAHRAAESLGESDQTMLSHYVGELAGGISDLANSLRHKNTDEILHDVSRLARDNAGLFVLGSVAIGFGLARIAKASQSQSQSSDSERRGWEGYYGVGTAEYEETEGRSPGGSSGQRQSSFSETDAQAKPGQSGDAQARTAQGSRSQGSHSQDTPSQDAKARPATHAETSYLPDNGSAASASQQSESQQANADSTIIGSETKPPSGDSSRRV